MEFLKESILDTKGYTTYHSPEGADQGLLVSWGGFKSSVEKERPNRFSKFVCGVKRKL